MKECEPFKALLVGLLDQELTPDESRQVNDHLTRCAACRQEYEHLRETTGHLNSVTFKEPTDRILEQVWKSPYSRFARNSALLLVIGGYAALIGFALFAFLTSGREAAWAKASLAAIVLGFLILLIQLIRERVSTYKSDPYKEIER